MSRKVLYLVIVFAFISLTGVVLTQIYWVSRAFSLQEKEFNDRVVIAMTAVVERIQAMNHDSALVKPVQQVSSNYFVANINDTLHPYLLESLLREEFKSSNLIADFEYGIYDCFNDSIVFGSKLRFENSPGNPVRENVSIQKKFDREGHYFGIYYPNKNSLLLGQMDFWVFSSILILLVVVFFSYTIMVILRQRRLSEVKTDFINNMTHELKTPISTIALSTDMLLKQSNLPQPDHEQLKRYAGIIKSENDRLKNQVEKVLQIATLSPEKMNLKMQSIDINQLVESAVASIELRLEETDGIIKMNLTGTTTVVNGDLVHLSNVIFNLLDNAIKYCRATPEIEISTRTKGKKLEINIKDNGIGIPSEHMKAIFDKFFRVPMGNTHDVKGFGLGLFYVKTVVEAHHGSVEVKSTPGKGSIFTITLPISNS